MINVEVDDLKLYIGDDYIIRSLESDIARMENDHLTWSNGENVGEIVADYSLFIPRNSADPSCRASKEASSS